MKGVSRGAYLQDRAGREGEHFGVFIDDGAETLLDVADAIQNFSLGVFYSKAILRAYNNAGLAVRLRSAH